MILNNLFESRYGAAAGVETIRQLVHAVKNSADIDLKVGPEMFPIVYSDARYLLQYWKANREGGDATAEYFGNANWIEDKLAKRDYTMSPDRLKDIDQERLIDITEAEFEITYKDPQFDGTRKHTIKAVNRDGAEAKFLGFGNPYTILDIKKAEKVTEASYIDGKEEDPKSLRWKQTSMSYKEASEKYGKDKVRKEGKNRAGQEIVAVHVPLGEGTHEYIEGSAQVKEETEYQLWWNGEEIDSFASKEEAVAMQKEYEMAYKGGVSIKKAKVKESFFDPHEKKIPSPTSDNPVTKRVEEDDFKPHMMYDPKTGEGKHAKVEKDHLDMKAKGWGHDKPKANMNKVLTALKKKLKDEGGAAGFDPLKAVAKKMDVNLTPAMLKGMSGIKIHRDGDYILEEGYPTDYKGWKYDIEYIEDEDTRKKLHSATKDGKRVSIDWSPYSNMTDEQFKTWIDLGMPNRKTVGSIGPLDVTDLEQLMKTKLGTRARLAQEGKPTDIELDVLKYTDEQVAKAITIARGSDGDMTGATDRIEAIANGLSNHSDVAKVLKIANEAKDDITKKLDPKTKVALKKAQMKSAGITKGDPIASLAFGLEKDVDRLGKENDKEEADIASQDLVDKYHSQELEALKKSLTDLLRK